MFMKRVLLFLFLISNIVLAQRENLRKVRQAIIDVPHGADALKASVAKSSSLRPTNAVANWVLVDSMTNIYGYLSEEIHPFYYSPKADKITLVHRGDATSYAVTSGEIYYNLSSNGGITWSRCNTPFNPSGSGRYPSGSIYYNSTVNDYYQFAVWPELFDSVTFGDLDAGVDFPLGTCNPYAFIDFPIEPNKYYGVGQPTWSSEEMAFWATTINDGTSYTGTEIWRTPNFSSPSGSVPSSLDTTRIVNNLNQFGGDAIKVGSTTVTAYAFAGTSYILYHPNIDSAILSSHTIHVIYSIDNGTTWSDLDSVSLSTLPGIGDYRTLWSWSGSIFNTPGHMVLDSLGYPHIVCGLQREPSGEFGVNVVIAEIYKEGNGYPSDLGIWKGKIITNAYSGSNFMNVQVGFMPNIARNEQGTFFAAQWIDSKQANRTVDLFVSGRYWKALNWRTPENISQTSTVPEYVAHLSPRMKRDGDSLFTIFTTVAFPDDINNPLTSPNRTRVYAGSYQLNLTPIRNDVTPLLILPSGTILLGDSLCVGLNFRNNGENGCDSVALMLRILHNQIVVYADSTWKTCPPDTVNTQIDCYLPPDTGLYVVQLIMLSVDQVSSNDTVAAFVRVITRPSIAFSTVTKAYSPYTEITEGIEIPRTYEIAEYIELPFPFVYDGFEYDSLQISGYGWIEFGKSGWLRNSERGLTDYYWWWGPSDNYFLYGNKLRKILAPWWDDLSIAGDPISSVSYATFGITPNRVFVVQWKNMLAYYDSINTTTRLNFQVHLYENQNVFEFHYGTVQAGTFFGYDAGASIGFNDHIGGSYHFVDLGKMELNGIPCEQSNCVQGQLNPLYNWPGPDSCFRVRTKLTANTIAYDERWNLVSVPLERDEYSISAIFPTAISGTLYRFDGEYHNETGLQPGNGYWLKFPAATIQTIPGTALPSIAIDVNVGWNLIGSISLPVAVSAITSTPGGIITSQFYQYAHGYATADTIFPGKGYWVKVNQSGQLILSSVNMTNAQNRINIIPISELPPAPPEELDKNSKLPKEFALRQNYPNPFNPSTQFTVELPRDAHVELVVYNLLGQKVVTLMNELKQAGYHTIVWNGRKEEGTDMPTGIYFVKMVSENFSAVRKIMLLK